ncbi:MAG: hypothetical protein IJR46_01295 [Neisseriaceae bacterium]|nr:hypothetical protein [Neisseriaceae bacterium]
MAIIKYTFRLPEKQTTTPPKLLPSLRASKASVAISLLWKTHQIYTTTMRLLRRDFITARNDRNSFQAA